MGTFLVTGAAGFIGSHLCEALLARGEQVVGVDNLDPFYDEALKRRNLSILGEYSPFRFVHEDIRDAPAMALVFAETKPHVVVHLAAKAGVRPSIADPIGYADTNVRATSIVLEHARRVGVERMVVASSSSVYGNAPNVPFREDDHAIMPISPYAATKRAAEMICHAHAHLTGMPTACLRFFTVYGPRQRPDLAISKFLRMIAAGEAIPVFGDGSSSRDYTYINDIVVGILAAIERIPAHGFRVWNLGSDSPIRLDALIDAIAQVVGREAVIDRQAMQAGDVERTWSDLTRSRAELGYAPSMALADGLGRQWSDYSAPRSD